MNSRDRLILLADKLDKKGLATEASIIDQVIVKRSFDEGTRENIGSVITMINQYVEELLGATRGEEVMNKTTGESSFVGGLPLEHREIFEDKLVRINEAVETLSGLNTLSEDDDDIGMVEETDADGPAEDGAPVEEEKGDTWDWMKFWRKTEEDEKEGSDEFESDETPPSFEEEFLEEEFDSPSGSVRRTRGRGLDIQQSMNISNVGNINTE